MKAADSAGKSQDIPQESEVLIVGGGPVGLSAAVELGRRGVQCVVIEPRLVVSQLSPRAKTVSVRTMEHFRRWGLAEHLREVAPLKVDWSQDVVFCTSLLGYEVTRFTNCFGLTPQRSEVYAESGQQVAQPLVEEVLREAVTSLESCQFCLGWSLRTLQQHEDGVEATIINEQGEQRQIRASYVVGCDGARSAVRAAIGAHFVGTSDLRPNFGLDYEPTARPGARLPHQWQPDGASLYDRLRNGLTLLWHRDAADVAPFVEAATARGVPLTLIDVRDLAHEERYGASLLLVRPDQHVAWRGASVNLPTAQVIIDHVRGM